MSSQEDMASPRDRQDEHVQLLEAVVESSTDGIMVLESVRDRSDTIVDFRWTHANTASERIFGRPCSWFIGERLLKKMPGDWNQGLFDAYREVVETGRPWTGEFQYMREGLDARVRARATKAGDGIVVNFRDIAEQRWIANPLDVADPRAVEDAWRESEARLEAMINSVDQMIWSTRPDGFHDYFNSRWYEYTGAPDGSTDGEAWSEMFHPDDRERTWARWRESLTTGKPYHIEYRLRHRSGEYRWVIGRAQPVRDAGGAITRWFGSCTDIHDLKVAEEQRELVTRELSHRIKNIFALIMSLVTLSARSTPEAEPFANVLRGRIDALAHAHEFVRPGEGPALPDDEPHTVADLFRTLLAAYREADRDHIEIAGGECEIGAQAATTLALVFHELATNAIKYGALSTTEGRISISCTVEEEVLFIVWRETGGPAVLQAPEKSGFGMTMSRRAASAQLGASIEHHWLTEGLTVEMRIPLAALTE